MAAEAEAQFSIGQVIPGTRYRVRGLIGAGGMGSVYEVEHEELGKLFVLKALRPQLLERKDLAARMKNEWHALGRLEHPNIVRVTDAGRTANGVPYYVMERLTGETLAARLRREGPMSVPSAIRVATAILDALAAAHAIGVVHRDIKPQNVFLPSGGGLKLLDFGVAKLRDRAALVVTRRGVAIGTPKYMSPEQAEGNPVDGRADLYAVGLVLFELVAGRGPFAHHREPNDLVLAHITEVPPRLDETWPGVPAELADLVQRWLSKDPADRPLDAGVAARELGRLLERFGRGLGTAVEMSTLGADYEATTRGPGSGPFGVTRDAGTAPTRTAVDAATSTARGGSTECSEVTRTGERSRTPPPVEPGRSGRSRFLGWAQRGAWVGAAAVTFALGALLAGGPLGGGLSVPEVRQVPEAYQVPGNAELPPPGPPAGAQRLDDANGGEPASPGGPGVAPTSEHPTVGPAVGSTVTARGSVPGGVGARDAGARHPGEVHPAGARSAEAHPAEAHPAEGRVGEHVRRPARIASTSATRQDRRTATERRQAPTAVRSSDGLRGEGPPRAADARPQAPEASVGRVASVEQPAPVPVPHAPTHALPGSGL